MANATGRPSVARTRGLRASVLALSIVVAAAGPGLAQSTDTTSDTSTTETSEPSSSTSSSTTSTPDSSTSTSDDANTTETSDAEGETTSTSAGGATSTSSRADEELEAERERLEQAEAANERKIDAASADLRSLTNALSVLNQKIKTQQAQVDIASQQVEQAEAVADAATSEVTELEATVADLEDKGREQAIRSFKGNVVEIPSALVASDLNDTARMRTLLDTVTRSNIDYVTELVNARDRLELRLAQAADAVAVAENLRQANEAELASLERDRAAQAELAADADEQLDHLLSERAALASLGVELEAQSADENALVKELADVPAPPPPATPTPAPSSTGALDIRSAGKGIEVDVSIVDDIRRLLADAEAAGVNLAGGGYRDPAAQIRVRRNNCGTSNYAIYEMPARQCRPPTARPGRSMHEQGKAIDFTYNGRLIRSRSGPGWNWLKANAAKYGLKNLPSEPWHWSTNGR